jgi:phytoene synthase
MLLDDKNISAAKPDDLLAAGYLECKAITEHYGTSYYFATQFFPRELRNSIYAVYAFARIPDEIVDDPNKGGKEETLAKLNEWRERWLAAMAAGGSDDAVLNAIVDTFRRHNITVEDGEAFLRSMFMDEEVFSYDSYEHLEDYMYGSAGVIGIMVTKIVGFGSDEAFPYAIKLGYAFQLTNFLRDIKQDYDELGRIYMPRDEMRRFGLTERDIATQNFDERFVEFMNFQIERNRQIYREALPGIPMLHWRGRMAVRIAYVLYKAILNEIERVNYNIYRGRVRTSFRRKLLLSAKALVGVYE